MALLNFFKKKKKKVKETKKELKKVKEVKTEKKEEIKPPQVEIQKPKKEKKISEISPGPKDTGLFGKGAGSTEQVLKAPHISEKATDLGKGNQYVFEVYPKANKTEIKKAIEGLYKVNVLSVNIAKSPAKKRRLRRTFGFKKGYKKAIVKIKEGQKIEIL